MADTDSSTDHGTQEEQHHDVPFAKHSPIQRLSPELLSMIFTFTTRIGSPIRHSKQLRSWKDQHVDKLSNSWYPELGTKTEPRSLLLVCKHWHFVAISTPGVWSHFSVRCETFGRRKVRTRIRAEPMFKIWLKRSQATPLSIFVFATSSSIFPEELLETRQRWRSLELYLDIRPSVEELKDLLDTIGPSPLLKKISIRVRELRVPLGLGPESSNIFPLASSPNLQIMDIPAFRLNTVNTVLPISLTHLTIRCINNGISPSVQLSLQQVHQLLKYSPQLTHFAVESPIWSTMDENNALNLGRVAHPNLQSLTMYGTHKFLMHLIDHIELPSISSLHISILVDLWPTIDDYDELGEISMKGLRTSLLAFMQHSGPQLESLGMLHTNFPDTLIFNLLGYAPNLRKLILHTDKISDDGLQTLTLIPEASRSGGHGNICPHLKSLIWTCELYKFSTQQFVDTLCSRWRNDSSVIFYFRRRSRKHILADAWEIFHNPQTRQMMRKGAFLSLSGFTARDSSISDTTGEAEGEVSFDFDDSFDWEFELDWMQGFW